MLIVWSIKKKVLTLQPILRAKVLQKIQTRKYFELKRVIYGRLSRGQCNKYMPRNFWGSTS